jgi:hypothetical protein
MRPGATAVAGIEMTASLVASVKDRSAGTYTREWAIEVEATAKPLDQYLAILDPYADHGVASYWYAVPPIAQERVLQAAAVLDVRDLVAVWDWPPVTARQE